MSRPSQRSWWGGLYKRLLAKGLDAYSAKMVARHVRADFKVYAEAFLEDVTEERFRELFLGEAT